MSVRLTLLQKILKEIFKEIGREKLEHDFEHIRFCRYTSTKFYELEFKEGNLVIGMNKMYHGGAYLFFINTKLKNLINDIERKDGKGQTIFPDAIISLRRENCKDVIDLIIRPEIGQDIKLFAFNKQTIQVLTKTMLIAVDAISKENCKILNK